MPNEMPMTPALKRYAEAVRKAAAQKARVDRLRKTHEVLGKVADHLGQKNPPGKPIA